MVRKKNKPIKLKSPSNPKPKPYGPIKKIVLLREKSRPQMQVVINSLIILGALGAISISILLYYHKQSWTIWTVFTTIVISALAGCLYWQEYVWKQEASSISTTLNQPTFPQKPNNITISVGDKTITRKFDELESIPYEPYIFQYVKPIKVYVDKGRLFVDVTLFYDNVSPPVKIIRGNYERIPKGWDLNSNSTALEIINEHEVPLYQLYYQTPTHVIIHGAFSHPYGLLLIDDIGTRDIKGEPGSIITLVIDPDELEQMPNDEMTINGKTYVKYSLAPLFKYPSWKYPGERK